MINVNISVEVFQYWTYVVAVMLRQEYFTNFKPNLTYYCVRNGNIKMYSISIKLLITQFTSTIVRTCSTSRVVNECVTMFPAKIIIGPFILVSLLASMLAGLHTVAYFLRYFIPPPPPCPPPFPKLATSPT